MGKKAKKTRSCRFIDSKIAARRNVQAEIRKTEAKIEKMLRINTKKRKNCKRKIRDEDGVVLRTVPCVRYQGMRPESKQHMRLLAHVARLKARAGALKNEHTVQPGISNAD